MTEETEISQRALLRRRLAAIDGVEDGVEFDTATEPATPRFVREREVPQQTERSRLDGVQGTRLMVQNMRTSSEGGGWPEGMGPAVVECEYEGETIPMVGFDGSCFVDLNAPDDEEFLNRIKPNVVQSRQLVMEGSSIEAWVVPGVSFAQIVAMAEAGAPVCPNLAYFHRPFYTFHPGTLPGAKRAIDTFDPLEKTGPQTVLTLDTGVVDAVDPNTGLAFQAVGNSTDPYSGMDEVVLGHGPAIADYIGRLVGSAEYSKLATIDYQKSAAAMVDPSAALAWSPMDNDHPNKNLVRCFDGFALQAALEALVLDDVSVLNFSFGTIACPNAIRFDPARMWLAAQKVQVAVAAGNHGTAAPSFPAAYSTLKWPVAPNYLNRVISVGSYVINRRRQAKQPRQGKHGSQAELSIFSARGSLVDVYANGDHVPVAHHTGECTWSGTSFAAPLVAALLAVGVPMANLKADGDGYLLPNEVRGKYAK